MLSGKSLFFTCLAASVLSGTIAAYSLARAEAPQSVVVADAKTGALRIVVGGSDVAWFDRDGLHVIGSIEYGGTLDDKGRKYLEDKAGAAGDR